MYLIHRYISKIGQRSTHAVERSLHGDEDAPKQAKHYNPSVKTYSTHQTTDIYMMSCDIIATRYQSNANSTKAKHDLHIEANGSTQGKWPSTLGDAMPIVLHIHPHYSTAQATHCQIVNTSCWPTIHPGP